MVNLEGVQEYRLESGARVVVARDYSSMSELAAWMVAEQIQAHPGSAMTLPTGETPRGMYEVLTRLILAGELDFRSIEFFCLDDYLGKGIHDETSLTAWLDKAFLSPAQLDGPTIHFVPTLAPNPDEAAAEYEASIQALGGFQLAVLGLGPNGHIGFNEPGSPIDSRTRVVNLTDESRTQNAAYYESDQAIPDKAMTIGIGTLLEARQIVLIVSGGGKASILRESLQGPVTPEVPGSFLQTVGPRLTVVLDQDAASALSLA